VRDPFADASEAPSAPSQVDWRWDLIKTNWSTGAAERETGAAYVSEIAKRQRDSVLPAMWDFYDELQSNTQIELNYPSMAKAYEVMTTRPKAKLYIEGMTLCAVPPAEISAQCGVAPSVISAYEAMFFDVRSYLHLESWVCELVFGGDVLWRLNHRDAILLSRRIAWLAGPGVFHSLFGGGRSCPELMKRAEQHIHEITRKSALLRSMVRGRMDEELDVAMIQEVIESTRAASALDSGASPAGFEARHANAVISMLSAVPLSVADPSLQATLEQPARDPRTSDTVAEVLRSKAAQPVVAEVQ
jgi:hypothetical protein